MSLLDCGCGPGAITLDLAEAVSPGQVVGIDNQERQVDTARGHAAERGSSNVRFQVASIYELPFEATSFDAVFIHAVLEHLSELLKALIEVHRVLRVGGIVGIRHGDWDGMLSTPSRAILKRGMDLYERAWKEGGGDPRFGKHQKRLLREAGFSRIQASASYECADTPEAIRLWTEPFVGRLTKSTFVERVLEEGWADKKTLQEMAAAFQDIWQHPDAFLSMAWCEAVGWKE